MPRVAGMLCLVLALLWPAAAPHAAADEDALWALLARGEGVALIRHARAPGTGDPANFTLEDCATQRNLSEEGRAQARALGQRFKEKGVPVAAVLSSRWCRCLETARLAFGNVKPFPPLDSFFQDRGTQPAQTAAVRAHLEYWDGPGALVMVTHQVNITALTGVVPSEGEIVVLSQGPDQKFALAGRIMAVKP